MKYWGIFLVLVFFSSSFGQLVIKNNTETEIMRVTDDGNVGIGTESPQSKLEVKGENHQIRVADITSDKVWTFTTFSDQNFGIYEDGTTARIMFQEGGQVGIGTTNPARKLHIEGGNLRIGGTGNGIELQRSSGSYSKILFVTPNNAGGTLEENATVLTSIGGNGIHLFPNNAGKNGLTVDYEGRVGIGTINPSNKLHVTGNIRMVADNPALILQDDTNWASVQNGNNMLRLHSENSVGVLLDINNTTTGAKFVIGANANSFTVPGVTNLLTINENGYIGQGGRTSPNYPIHANNGAYLSAGGTWTNASSREYKENIQDLSLQEAIETCMALDPKKYNYKTDPEEYLGFIAEDVPDLVAYTGRKGLSSMDITAVLTKVVQEQQKRIDQLETKIQSILDLY